MIYFVISSSDDQHELLLEALNDEIATAAILAISSGSMGLLREDGGFVMPADMQKAALGAWLFERMGTTLPEVLINGLDRLKLAAALDSFFVGTRAEYTAKNREWAGYKPDIRAELRKAWDESRNGGGPVSTAQVAWAIAAKLREAQAAPPPTPEIKEANATPSQ